MSSKLVFFSRLWKHRKLSRPWTWPVNMSLNMNYITYYLRFTNPSYICTISTKTKQIKCNNFTFISSLSPLLFVSIILKSKILNTVESDLDHLLFYNGISKYHSSKEKKINLIKDSINLWMRVLSLFFKF